MARQPMHRIILVKTASEISLKSNYVQAFFMKKLVENMRTAFRNRELEGIAVEKGRGRLFVEAEQKTIDDAAKILPFIFGIHAFAFAEKHEGAEMQGIKKHCLAYAKSLLKSNDSFALRVSRAGSHSFSSHDIAVECGAEIMDKLKGIGISVNLSKPEKEIFIEVINNSFYLYPAQIHGPKGIPLGVEGSVAMQFKGSQHEALAAWLLMKRGCRIFPLAEKPTAEVKKALASLVPWNSFRQFKISKPKELKSLEKQYNIQAIANASSLPNKKPFLHSLALLQPIALYPKEMIEEKEKLIYAKA